MNEFKNEINFATLSDEELNNIAGGRDMFEFPPGFDPKQPVNCSKCGTPTYVSLFSWGQTNLEDGFYDPDAWIAKFKCKNCGHYWTWGADINDRD